MIGILSGKQDKCKIFMEDIGQGNRCIDILSIIDETQKDSMLGIIDETWKNP